MENGIHVCGVTCHTGDANCNGYCDGKADRAKALTDDEEIERLTEAAKAALKDAEAAWLRLARKMPKGQRQGWAESIHANIMYCTRHF